jgi:hypothetical protein
MEGYSEIARRFGISRQRVEQVFLKHNHGARNKRKAALDKFVKPYFVGLGTGWRCPLCGKNRPISHFLCHDCREALGILKEIKTQLRGYAKDKNRSRLIRASYLIRKHGVKPDALNFV